MSPKENIIVLRHARYSEEMQIIHNGQVSNVASLLQDSISSGATTILSSTAQRAYLTAQKISEILSLSSPIQDECLWDDDKHEGDEDASLNLIQTQTVPNIIVVTHLDFVPSITYALYRILIKGNAPNLNKVNYSEGWHINVPNKTITKIS